MKEYDDISVEVKDYIAKITIQRPPNNFFDSFLIQQIADAAKKTDRKLAILGPSMIRNVALSRELGLLKVSDSLLLNENNM